MSADFSNSEEKRINCEGGFGIIPFYLSIDKSIPDGAKLLFSDMWLAQLQTGYCSLSNSELAKIRNVSARTITNWVGLLKEKGWIKTQYIITQQGEIKQRNIYLNPKPEINNIQEKISEADFVGYRNQLLGGTEPSFQVYNIREDIIKKNILPKTGFGDVEISSVKSKKVKTTDDWKSNEAFTKLWYSLPEYMRRCGGSKGYKAWKQETKNGTVNVENIDKATRFYLMNLQDGLNPQYLSTFLNQGTWDEFYTRAVEQEQKQEKARVLREKKQKEEAEQRKRVLKERAQVFEAKYQALKNKLNAGYDTLEEISQNNEELFYDVVQQIRDYERKLEEKEAEIKHQKEIEQKKIDAENSKHNLDECERELWTYISQVIDANAYLDRNKKRLPNSYETFKNLFSNGETLLEVVFGDKSKESVVDSLKNNILVFLMHEMSNEEVRNLYNKRNEAWTIWNKTKKEIA
ncbi:MAG: helix-turn-helix domain-containing protein [Methanobrevibacter sp.]|nr:helix-turn-helix domain-containing protein [Methanobrevibacter sp.]